MTAPATSPLSPLKKGLLLAAGACAVATPVTAGLLTSPEGRQVVARATAGVLGASAPRPTATAQDGDAGKPVVLARNEALLAPGLAVARLDIAPASLIRDLSAPPSPPSPQPVQVATAEPPSTRVSPEAPVPARLMALAPALPADPEEIKRQVADFVGSYGSFTSGPWARSYQTARWGAPLCIQIVGITAEQEAAIRARIAEVAKGVDLTVQGDSCGRRNLEIAFSTDPQGMIDNLAKKEPAILGDRTSDSRTVKTMTLPIQAWYLTNGVTFAENGSDGLKALVVYQSLQPGSVGMDGRESIAPGSYGPAAGGGPASGEVCCGSFPGGSSGPGISGGFGDRLFVNVLVVVDMRRPEIRTKSLGRIADYLAMVALSQPRALDQCNVLASVTDLFASCADRIPPDGLTPADAAYLTALYPQGRGRQSTEKASIVARMAKIMVNDRIASR